MRLYNEQFGRRMAFGAAWGKIRILVRFAIEATSTMNASSLMIGVSQGTTNMFRSGTTTDFVGMCMGAVVGANTWTFQAGPPPFAQLGGFVPLAVRRIGNTNTTVAPGGSLNIQMPLSPIRNVCGVDIEKSDASFRVKPLAIGVSTVAQTDLNFGNLMFNADNDTATIPLIGHSPNFLTLPYTGNFAMDSVNIDWNNGIQPCVISDIVVIRFF